MGGRVQVLFVPFRGEAVAANPSPLRWKRRAVWDNRERNRLVADVADGLAVAARKTLRKLGVKVGAVRLPDRVRQRVVVLAETAEHAWELEKLLPKWEVLEAVPVEDEHAGWGMPPDSEADPPPGTIATLVYVARYGIICDVLVRATAGTGRLNWDAILGRGGRPGTTPALVVDFEDQSGTRERTDAEIRRREYREQGLEVLRTVMEGEQYT